LTAVKLGPNNLSGTWRLTLFGSKVTSSSSSTDADGDIPGGAETEVLDCSWANTCWSPGDAAKKSSSSYKHKFIVIKSKKQHFLL